MTKKLEDMLNLPENKEIIAVEEKNKEIVEQEDTLSTFGSGMILNIKLSLSTFSLMLSSSSSIQNLSNKVSIIFVSIRSSKL